MKIKGNLYILQSCQMFSWDYFQFWEETYSQWYLGKKAKDNFYKIKSLLLELYLSVLKFSQIMLEKS